MINRFIVSRNFEGRFHNLGLRSLLQPLKTKSVHSLETSEVYNLATQRKNPDDSNPHHQDSEKLKFPGVDFV